MSKALKEITVSKFNTIFFLPLTGGYSGDDKNWKQIPLKEHFIDIDEKVNAVNFYNEKHYFHKFIQDFIYKETDVVALYKRSDILEMSVTLYGVKNSYQVKRLNLYCFEKGIAFLIVEIEAKSTHSLSELLNFHDKVRRFYPNFYEAKDDFVKHSHQNILVEFDGHFLEDTRTIEANTPFSHWENLLPANVAWKFADDDRMPLLSHVQIKNIDDYRKIKSGDWSRIAFVDGAGDNRYPYAKGFLDKYNECYYDRYHYQSKWESNYNPVRFCISGYSFVSVGIDDSKNESGKNYYSVNTLAHMQRQYFQIMLIAQFEFAKLLDLSKRMSSAVQDTKKENKLREIQIEFLEYTHRYHFTGITNQLQGQELNALLRKNMQLDEFYQDVKEEISASNNYLSMENAKNQADRSLELAKTATKQADATISLAMIAAIGLVFSLSIAFLSMGLFFGDEVMKSFGFSEKCIGIATKIAICSLVIALFSLFTKMAVDYLIDDANKKIKEKTTRLLCRITLFFLIVAIATYSYAHFYYPVCDLVKKDPDPTKVEIIKPIKIEIITKP